MPEKPFGNINTSLLAVLICIMVVLIYMNIQQDILDEKTLNSIECHKDIEIPEIKNIDKLVIESVIENYWSKRTMNRSNRIRIYDEIMNGSIKGAIGGAIIGGSALIALEGAVVHGAISGAAKAYNLLYKKTPFINDNKHT